MKAITLRGVDDETYGVIKKVSQNVHTSMNKLIINLIREKFTAKTKSHMENFSPFLGSWSPQEYQRFLKNTNHLRKTDKELWA